MKEGSTALMIKNILDPARDKFVSDVNTYRVGIDESVFEGAVYTPSQSIDLKLVDELGTLQTAFDKIVTLSKTTKPNKSNTNKNKNMNAKQLPLLQAVLGLDAPLASTEENGSYLNADQLDTLENRLVELEGSNSTLITERDAALANTEVKDQLTASQGTVTAVEASIDNMLASAGLDATGNLTEKTAALSAKVAEMGKNDATKPTVIKVGATTKVENAFVDSNASHNKMANEIFNK
jgi:protease-4